MDLRSALGQRVLFLDGALGTEFYARGVFINRSYDELNLTQPDLVRAVHEDYVRAGADLITTNTFGANRVRLQPFGLEQRAEDIARAGVRLAKEASRGRAAVLGSVGPTGAQLHPVGRLSPGSAYSAFRTQIQVMAKEGVDALLLETFTSLSELWQAVRAARDVAPELPLITCMSFNFEPDGTQVEGEEPEEAARVMHGWGVAAMGVNCSNGPQVVLKVLERMARVTDKPLVAYPNAGMPQVVEGRTLYLAAPEYMAEYARRLVQKGASVVGGCCGTTPPMLREMRSYVRSVTPGMRAVAEPMPEEAHNEDADPVEEVPVAERSELARKISEGEFVISVELDPPRGLDPSRSLEGAAFLKEQGIDVINIADGPRAVARMGPMALAQLARQRCGIESVIHYCCRDRNLLGMQMDLLGAHALGMHNVLAVTGDPPKMGTYPNATAVFDIDSIGLLHFITRMNRGLDFSGRPMDGRTHFYVGAGCNPAHVELEREVERYGKKIEAGAKFFFSQPVYDPEVLERFFELTAHFPRVPFLVGILPLASYKNAEFLHNEVPGMQVPQAIRDRLRAADTRKDQRRIGIEVARQTLADVYGHPRVQGAYIYPPFGSYKAVMKVVDVLPRFASEEAS
ncbi:MAG: bifunctional homocysteine S-methyltransferase/methylenetetrahydrofolate reductase [Alphaproteobacteria bacterium]|nr:bifunctional homocysteine S-methyltransferase/methylenetetrahydrofolate reductase [Alphaproteobacteria bacterium]MCB9795667.1 bifunctional homocysteine S-methyltransferase/methylenetetrahydrofolate reductase [Alphaproteobacteria bacterium]